jgi:pyrroline-5-carboxylate reductase
MVVLQVIGGGRMGEALVGGLLKAGGHRLDGIRVVEPDSARREAVRAAFPGVDVVERIDAADDSIVAVKPADIPAVCEALASHGPCRVLSIAAGVTIGSLEAALAPGSRVVRAMPNTPAVIGLGAAAVAPGSAATEEDLVWAEELLGAVGVVVRVKEALLDAVTGLSGSGPAYVFLVAESLIEAGVLAGLPRDVSRALAVQTVLGAATLLADGADGPEALRAAVTSPGGTTAAGLQVLEQRGLRAAFLDAVAAATDRSRALGS